MTGALVFAAVYLSIGIFCAQVVLQHDKKQGSRPIGATGLLIIYLFWPIPVAVVVFAAIWLWVSRISRN